jgi:hypothetical protein
MYDIPSPQYSYLTARSYFAVYKESHFPDQTAVEEVSRTQVLSARESLIRWLVERGEFALNNDI